MINSKFLKLYNLIMEDILKQSKIASFQSTKIQTIDDFKQLLDSNEFKGCTKISKQLVRGLQVNIKTTSISQLLNKLLDEETNIKVLNRNDIITIKLPDNKIVQLRGSVSGYLRAGSSKLRTDLYQSIIALSVNKLLNGEDVLFSNEWNIDNDLEYVKENLSLSIDNENILNALSYYKNTILKAPQIIFQKYGNENLFCYHTKFKNKINIKIFELGKISGIQKDKINPGDIWLINLNSIDEINQKFSACKNILDNVDVFNDLLNQKKLIGISLKQFSGQGHLNVITTLQNSTNDYTYFDPNKFIGAVCDISNLTGNNFVFFKFDGIPEKYYGIEGRIGGNATGGQSITLEGKQGKQRHGKARSLLSMALGIKNSSIFMNKPLNEIMDISSIQNIKNDIICDNEQLNYLLTGYGQAPYQDRINQRRGRDRALLSILLYCYNIGGQKNYKNELLNFASKTLTIPIKGQKQKTASYVIVH